MKIFQREGYRYGVKDPKTLKEFPFDYSLIGLTPVMSSQQQQQQSGDNSTTKEGDLNLLDKAHPLRSLLNQRLRKRKVQQ